MSHEQNLVQQLYRRLLSLYPRAFRERLGESMQQTFDDLYRERKRQSARGWFGFVLWIFLETASGIFKERLRLVAEGAMMQTTLKTFGSSALLGLLLILPLATLEVINRRSFNEAFPFILFFVLWLNLFAISLILLPIVVGMRSANADVAQPVSTQRTTLLTNPW